MDLYLEPKLTLTFDLGLLETINNGTKGSHTSI